MDWNDLFAALALYLILEGLFPFLSPRRWQETVALLAQMSASQLRIFGLFSVCAGLALLVIVRG
jgi:uncharacterized protein YjeT (DUF2065 family)